MKQKKRVLSYIAISLIRLYQLLLSPLLGKNCRFLPTCSQYAIEAFSTHHFLKALFLTCKRILKCGPWHPGGCDFVPPAKSSTSAPHAKSHPLKDD